jgi:hypothetical protein
MLQELKGIKLWIAVLQFPNYCSENRCNLVGAQCVFQIQRKKQVLNKIDIAKLVSGIRIRTHMFLLLLDPEPLVKGTDPDPDSPIIKQK